MAAPLAEPEAALVFAVEATVFVEALESLALELFVTEDASVEEVTEDAVDAVAPPTPDGCVSKSVVEPVAQLITSPNPAAKAPIP